MTNTVIFFVVSIAALVRMKKNSAAVLFNILFLFSYFLTAFAYPAFIHPFDEYYFIYGFNEKYINKGTALALVGICAYLFGFMRYFTKKGNEKTVTYSGRNLYSGQSTLFLKILVIAVTVFFFFNLERDANLGMLSLYKSLVISLFALLIFKYSFSSDSPIKKLIVSNIFIFGISVALGLALLTTGDRGPSVFIFSVLMGTVMIQMKTGRMFAILIPSIVLGTFYLFAIQQFRSDSDTLSLKEVYTGSKTLNQDQENIWNYGSDLINSSRNIYLGMEYVDKKGFFYGQQYVLFAGSIIPYTMPLLNIDDIKSTGTYITEYHQYKYSPTSVSGMGTQVSVDLYMDFGIVGVLAVMYLFGLFAGYCSLKWDNNIYALVGLLFLISTAVYIPRSSLMLELRVYVWSVFAIFLNSLIFARPKYRFTKISKNRNHYENSGNQQ